MKLYLRPTRWQPGGHHLFWGRAEYTRIRINKDATLRDFILRFKEIRWNAAHCLAFSFF